MAQDLPTTGSSTPDSGSASPGQQAVNAAFISKPTAAIPNKQRHLELLFPEYKSVNEPLLTAADLTMNPFLATAAFLKNRIIQSKHNINIPVYGFTLEDPKMVKLEDLFLYNHYMPSINYASLNGISTPDRIYASRVRIPVLHDGGFMTTPEILKTPEKINLAISNHPVCFVDGAYLSDLTVIPKDRLVKVKFVDKAQKIGRIIGVSEFNTVLADSIKEKFSQTGIPFQGLLGMFGSGAGSPGSGNINNPTPAQEFWTLVAICVPEAGSSNPQGMADVAQSIYNRYYLANKYGGYEKTISANISTGRQYEPTFKNQTDWQNITNESSAIYAIKNGPRPTMSEESIKNALQASITALRDPSLRESARGFVGARPDFLAYSPQSPVVAVERSPAASHNNFHVQAKSSLRTQVVAMINAGQYAPIPSVIQPFIEGGQTP